MQIALDVGLLCGTDVRIFVLYEVSQYTFSSIWVVLLSEH